MNFNHISSPAKNILTLRLDREGEDFLFRPSSTGHNKAMRQLEEKVKMEQIEELCALQQAKGFIASAAHTSKAKSIENATNEAIERLSLSSWWALRRPTLGRVDPKLEKYLLDNYFGVDSGFHITIGFVPPEGGEGFACVALLANSIRFPIAVLGGSFDTEYYGAVEKAFLESIQSWTASTWLREKNAPLPHWDIGEIRRRIDDIAQSPIMYPPPRKTVSTTKLTLPHSIETVQYRGAFCSFVYFNSVRDNNPIAYAEMTKRDDESICVFSPHNF